MPGTVGRSVSANHSILDTLRELLNVENWTFREVPLCAGRQR